LLNTAAFQTQFEKWLQQRLAFNGYSVLLPRNSLLKTDNTPCSILNFDTMTYNIFTYLSWDMVDRLKKKTQNVTLQCTLLVTHGK